MASNVSAREGNLVVDAITRKPFTVKRVLSNGYVEILGHEPTDKPKIVTTSSIERGLASGKMVRLQG